MDGRELAERQRQFAQGQPYDDAHKVPVRSRIEGRRMDGSNIIPLHDLIRAALGLVGFALGLFKLFAEGSASVFLSRSDPGITVTQPWALSAVAVGFAGVLVLCIATLVDHFDLRPNEQRYATVRSWAAAIGFVFMLLGTLLPV